jgi:hypothetical protein
MNELDFSGRNVPVAGSALVLASPLASYVVGGILLS